MGLLTRAAFRAMVAPVRLGCQGRVRGFCVREVVRNTPLFALDAVVLDTETTGLDPKTARLVEVGAVRLSGGVIREDEVFQRFVTQQAPIPAAAKAVHGIGDADLGGALPFAAMHDE